MGTWEEIVEVTTANYRTMSPSKNLDVYEVYEMVLEIIEKTRKEKKESSHYYTPAYLITVPIY